MTNYFTNCNTLEELKQAYRRLAMANHPDKGGSVEVMQEINKEYEEAFAKVKNIHTNSTGEEYTKETNEAPEEFINIINELVKMHGVIIEIIGSFLWLSGNTKEYKDQIKKLGFKWSNNKLMWYKSPEGYRKFSKKDYSINDIREMFGSEVYTKQQRDLLANA